LTLALPLSLLVACSGRDADRNSLSDEQERELDLALGGDSIPTSFEDTAVADQPGGQPATPVRQPDRSRQPVPPRVAAPPANPPRVEAEPEREPEPRMVDFLVGMGTTLSLTLDETLSTETNQPGDAFMATVSADLLDDSGLVLIGAGAKVRGRVVQVQKSGRVGETAILNLAFESLSMDGKNYPLEASVVSASPERVSRSSTGEQVGKVAAGAAAGAILGRVLGKDTKSTIKGAVVGAAAGTAIAMGTADVDAVLKAGSPMIIKLDQPVVITKVMT